MTLILWRRRGLEDRGRLVQNLVRGGGICFGGGKRHRGLLKESTEPGGREVSPQGGNLKRKGCRSLRKRGYNGGKRCIQSPSGGKVETVGGVTPWGPAGLGA